MKFANKEGIGEVCGKCSLAYECYVQELKIRGFEVQALEEKTRVEAPLLPQIDLNIRLEANDEE